MHHRHCQLRFAGFQLLQKLLGNSAFYGQKHPLIFMTDDSTVEKNALGSVWPSSQQLLCTFHVL